MAYKKTKMEHIKSPVERRKTNSEKMGKTNVYLKFVEIFPEYKRFCESKGSHISNAQRFLSKLKSVPESIKHMKFCIICRTSGGGPDIVPLCWNCMISIGCTEYRNGAIIEHIDHDSSDVDTCFDSLGYIHNKKCIHRK